MDKAMPSFDEIAIQKLQFVSMLKVKQTTECGCIMQLAVIHLKNLTV